MNFETPIYAAIVILVILLVIRMSMVFQWKKRAQKAFADSKMAKKLFQFSNLNQFIVSNFLIILSVVGLMIALMDPTTPGDLKKVEVKSSDVVYCLDLSNSMDAEDVLPSRVEKAKQIIRESLDKSTSDRVGLVVFANEGYPLVPLTQGYDAVESYLEILNTSFIGNQGTRFEVAIRAASNIFKSKDQTSKNVVFISDGEDQENDISETVKIADENNLNIIAIGVGTIRGDVIPESKNFNSTGLLLDENDNPVVTKLNESSLKKLASSTNGKYIRATNSDETSTQIRAALRANKNKGTFMQDAYSAHHHFQWPVGIALLLIIIVSLTNIRTQFNI